MSLATLAREMQASAIPRARGVAPPARPDGFAMLTRFIPTETVTLYVAALALEDTVASYHVTAFHIYAGFAIATPILLAVVTKRTQIVDPANSKPIHWFPLLASLLAFLVWGLSVPGLIDSDKAGLMALCGFGALVLSTLLSLVEPIAMQTGAADQDPVVTPAPSPAPPPPVN